MALMAGLAFAFAPPAPAQGASRSMTIVTRGYQVSRIGPFQPAKDARIAAAIRAFGRPSARVLVSRITCQLDWRRLRLRIYFSNLGIIPAGQTACGRTVSLAASLVVRHPRFRTQKGLRVGDPSSAIRRKHPDATFANGLWGVVLAVFPFGSDEPSPVVSAQVRGGRVSTLQGYIGAAGE